jgi:phytoene/squalene synthetase
MVLEFKENITECAKLVERGDADRFLATMAAPVEARARLFPLFALNLEVARAPFVTSEAMIAEMRLQWWRDVVEEAGKGIAPKAHPVATPIHDLIAAGFLDADLLDQMIAARRWDIYKDPFDDHDALISHLDHTGGHLMWLSAMVLGAPDDLELAARAVGMGAAIANWLRAVPGYEAQNRVPLVDGRADSVRDLAQIGLDHLARARGVKFGAATPAIRTAWRAKDLLKRVQRDPRIVALDQMDSSEWQRRTGLLYRVLTGGW